MTLHSLQENASKPEGLPPSQGGKYVGFGSQAAQPPRQNAGGEDYSAMLSKGISQLSTVAGEGLGFRVYRSCASRPLSSAKLAPDTCRDLKN